MHVKFLPSCPVLCDPMDHQAGSSVHRILQIRILERVAISFSKERVYLNAKKMMYFKKLKNLYNY